MEQLKVGFLGYGTRALTALMEDQRFVVKYFLAPRARLCKEVWEAYAAYHQLLEYIVIDNNVDLAERLSKLHDVDFLVMNACPIILNQSVLEQMPVFNIHPGDLHSNRGHHPHLWTVLLGEPTSQITLHEVNLNIDDGNIVKSVTVAIEPDDDAGVVLNKLEDQIPTLLDALYHWQTDGIKVPEAVVHQGQYRRKMTYADYQIDVMSDDLLKIKRKVLARSMHHGAFILQDQCRYYVDQITAVELIAAGPRSVLIDNEKQQVVVHTETEKIFFHLGKVETTDKERVICGNES